MSFIIPGVEKDWDTQHPGQARPFYLLGALDYNDGSMAPLINNDKSKAPNKPLFQRILGVNWPAAADNTVYEEYQARWSSRYGKREDGYENFYDAMYYLLYGVAASKAPLNGVKLTNGFSRVTAHGTKVPQISVGPGDDMVSSINALKDANSEIELIGAMGPPNWDDNGARHDPASIWCVNALGYYRPDQLRYDTADSKLKPTDGTLTNTTISCFNFPAQ